jgi:HEAT repeat protein
MPLFGPPNVEKLKAQGNVKGLVKALGYKKNANVRQAALLALVDLGCSRDAVLALQKMRDVWVAEPLVDALLDIRTADLKVKSEYTRAAAIDTLAQLKDPRAVKPLIAVLRRDKKYNLRAAAARALGRIGDVQALDPLIASLEDRNPNVHPAVAEALGEIGDARAVEALADALGSRFASEAAARALARIGTPATVEPLVAALRDGRRDVRKAAAEALVQIYRSGRLSAAEKHSIVAQRDTIKEHHDHHDAARHDDRTCGGWHYDSGIEHIDVGIGVEFPL